MVATDGHRMTICRLEQDTGLNVIVPRDDIEAAIALHNKRKGKAVLEIDVTTDRIGDIFYQPIDGKFPEWQKVVPKDHDKMEVNSVGFNARYMAEYVKAGAILGSGSYISMRQSKESAVFVVNIGQPEFLCLLMPSTSDVPKVPEWARAEAAA